MTPIALIALLTFIVPLSIIADAAIDAIRIKSGKTFNHALDFWIWAGITFLIVAPVSDWNGVLIAATAQWYLASRAAWFNQILNKMRGMPDHYWNPGSSFSDWIRTKSGIRWDKLNLTLKYSWMVSLFIFLGVTLSWAVDIGFERQVNLYVSLLFCTAFLSMMLYLTGIWQKAETWLERNGIK